METAVIRKLYLLLHQFPSLAERNFSEKHPIDRCFEWEGDDLINFEAREFAEWAKAQRFGHGADCACASRFILSVWNPESPKALGLEPFDIHEAMGCWDLQHRDAFLFWARQPFWC